MEDTPIFSNTCGMLFDDKVVFAFDNGEKQIPLSKITAAHFRERITNGFLMLILLPLPVYGLLDYIKNFDGLARVTGYAIAAAISGLAYYNARKIYRIALDMVSGSEFTIRVSANNRKDASKFINKLQKKLVQ
ncbi:hypothetical protein [uncultured Flavobacterium sp.]|uniref:hypothetical protein n=1 Tax=uncultured Flavobacterium sp. TaxID=165435 RepID=UPI0025FB3F34|nr:hypothetical protein [uncultured Flavobacterium sp.]